MWSWIKIPYDEYFSSRDLRQIASGYKTQNIKTHGLGFRALLAKGDVECLELLRI
jgi:hypothetical protein